MISKPIQETTSDKIFNVVNTIIMTFVLLIVIYPLYFVLIASVSEPYDVAKGNVTFVPVGFTLAPYINVFKEPNIWTGYRNTIIYTITGTLFSLFLTLTSAYALSKRYFTCKKFFTWYFLFTMYFGGGLIPTYLLVRDLKLLDKFYTLIILSSFSVFNMIITRTFFTSTIPESIFESAQIDGCGEIRAFIAIALPLSGSIIAVMALYYAVGRWNAFFEALIYLTNTSLMPLQIILRNILILNQTPILATDMAGMTPEDIMDHTKRIYMAHAMKYSLIFVACFPMLVAYPFVQKHFVKGVLIGSIKG